MKDKPSLISPVMFNVAYQDLVELWIETIHPNDHVLVVWDARNHLEVLKKSGFKLKEDIKKGDISTLMQHAEKFAGEQNIKNIMITLSEHGVILYNQKEQIHIRDCCW